MTSFRLQSNYSSTVTVHGGPVVLRPVRATPCLFSSVDENKPIDKLLKYVASSAHCMNIIRPMSIILRHCARFGRENCWLWYGAGRRLPLIVKVTVYNRCADNHKLHTCLIPWLNLATQSATQLVYMYVNKIWVEAGSSSRSTACTPICSVYRKYVWNCS